MEVRTDDVKDLVSGIVHRQGKGRENLLPVLEDVVEHLGYITDEALIEISRNMDISIGEIHGVASFYHFINTEKKGKFVVRLCKTISCDMANKDRIKRTLEKELGIGFGETTHDGSFTLEYTNCLGWCDEGPAMMINREVYTKLDPEKIVDIINRCKGGDIS